MDHDPIRQLKISGLKFLALGVLVLMVLIATKSYLCAVPIFLGLLVYILMMMSFRRFFRAARTQDGSLARNPVAERCVRGRVLEGCLRWVRPEAGESSQVRLRSLSVTCLQRLLYEEPDGEMGLRFIPQ